MKKIIYREFQTQDQDKIQSLVSIGLRNTAINQNLNIQARIEKYINESQESDLGHIDEYFKNGIFFVAEYKNEIVGSLGAIPETSYELRLKRMSVKKEYRRQGIAKNLLKKDLFQSFESLISILRIIEKRLISIFSKIQKIYINNLNY